MRSTRSLRLRGTVAFLLAGALLSALYTSAMHLFGHDMEMRFIEATLGEQMEHFTRMVDSNPAATPPATSGMEAFITTPDTEDTLPPYLLGLSPGTYDGRMYEGNEYHIMVRDHGGKRFHLAYIATEIEVFEEVFHNFLTIAGVVFSFVALSLGYWLSGRIISPITRLAQQVKQLSFEGERIRLAAEYSGDEVGDLAKTFDEYAERIQGFAQREKQFTADVTHELRTPVAVMRSTVELLLTEENVSESTRRRLGRLERAVHQMSELITVFLVLAREPQPSEQETGEMCAVEPVLREVVDGRLAKAEAKGLTIHTNICDNPEVGAPATVLTVVLGDVLDNAIAYTKQGKISIALDARGVTIADTGVGISPDVQPHIFERGYRGHKTMSEGAGLGLYIVKRLCERYAWSIEVDSVEGKGTQVRLVFSS